MRLIDANENLNKSKVSMIIIAFIQLGQDREIV